MNKVACMSTNKMLQTGHIAKSSRPTTSDEKTTKELLQELVAKHDKPAQVSFVTGGPCSSNTIAGHRPVATPQATLFPEPEKQLVPAAREACQNDAAPPPESNGKPATLKAMEEEASNQLQKGRAKALNKPASKIAIGAACQAAAKQKAAPKSKSKPAAQTKAKAKTVPKAKGKARLPGVGPGCSKCRGDGCSTCGKQSCMAGPLWKVKVTFPMHSSLLCRDGCQHKATL